MEPKNQGRHNRSAYAAGPVHRGQTLLITIIVFNSLVVVLCADTAGAVFFSACSYSPGVFVEKKLRRWTIHSGAVWGPFVRVGWID